MESHQGSGCHQQAVLCYETYKFYSRLLYLNENHSSIAPRLQLQSSHLVFGWYVQPFRGQRKNHYCWYQCTVKGGREGRDLDVIELVQSSEDLGAGEILLNCIDKDGTNSGFDLELIKCVKDSVSIPVIASSGAGKADHFVEVFKKTDVEAALAAGIFHRQEVPIQSVKECMNKQGIVTR